MAGCGTTTWVAAVFASGYRARTRPAPSTPPMSWAITKPGTEAGLMPAKVSLNIRPTVTAGLAKEVEEVNQ